MKIQRKSYKNFVKILRKFQGKFIGILKSFYRNYEKFRCKLEEGLWKLTEFRKYF